MRKVHSEYSRRWINEFHEGILENLKTQKNLVMKNNELWYKWHKTIYSGNKIISDDDFLKGEITLGIDFRNSIKN